MAPLEDKPSILFELLNNCKQKDNWSDYDVNIGNMTIYDDWKNNTIFTRNVGF